MRLFNARQHVQGQMAARPFFNEPTTIFPFVLVGAVRSQEDPRSSQGSILQLTPPDLVWAILQAVYDAVTAAAEDKDLMKWKQCMISATIRLEVLGNEEDRLWRASQLRGKRSTIR